MGTRPFRRLSAAAALAVCVAAGGAVAVASGGETLTTLAPTFSAPRGVALLPDGSFLVADTKGNQIVRVSGSSGQTVAGTGDASYGGDGGAATAAKLRDPAAVAPLPGGGFLIADTANHRIRHVTAAGAIATVAGTGEDNFSGDGGAATAAALRDPAGLVATTAADFVLADTGNDRVRRVAGGVISSLGSGFSNPSAVAVRPADGAVLVADTGNDRVAVVQDGATTTLPGGDGLDDPMGLAVRADGSVLVSDTKRHRVLEIRDGQRTVLAGTGAAGWGPDGLAAAAMLYKPEGLAVVGDGGVLIANTQAGRVHLIAPAIPPPPPTSPPADDAAAGANPGVAAPPPVAPGDGGVPAVRAAAATPELGVSVVTGVVRGTVRVRPRGADDYVVLRGNASLPLGSVVDATRGAVRLTSARNAAGAIQSATFSRGAFRVGQTGGKRPITDLALTGRLPACATGTTLARRSAGKAGRRLWGDGKGRFRTKGRHGAATVRGTRWLTKERCSGTLVRVVRGVVGVRDLTRRRTVTVRAGEKYLAKAPRARRRASR